MIVLDSSAVLAFLQAEPGQDLVRSSMDGDTCCGAANWSEVAQKVSSRGGQWSLSRALLQSFDVVVEPVTAADAERAALLWEPGTGLSLGDRLCLALAERLDAGVLTADSAWGDQGRIRQIR